MLINLDTYPLNQILESTPIENFIKKYNIPTNYFRLIHSDNNTFFRSIGYRYIQDIASKRQITKLEQLYEQIKEYPINPPLDINLEKGFQHLKSELIKSRTTQKIDQWIKQCKEIDYFIVCIIRHLIRKFMKKNDFDQKQIQIIENWKSNTNTCSFKAISQALKTKIHIYSQNSIQIHHNQLRPVEFFTYLISHDGKWYLLLQRNVMNKKKKKAQMEKQFASGCAQSKYQLKTPIKSNQNNTQTYKKQNKDPKEFIKTNEFLISGNLQERITQQQKQSTDRQSHKSIEGKKLKKYGIIQDSNNQLHKKIKSSNMFPKPATKQNLPKIYSSFSNFNRNQKVQEQNNKKDKNESRNIKFQILDQNREKNISKNQLAQKNDSYYYKKKEQYKAIDLKLKNSQNKRYQRGNTKVLTMKDFQKNHQQNNKEEQKIDQPLFTKQQITFSDNLSPFNQKMQNNNNSNTSYKTFQNKVKNDQSFPNYSNQYYNQSNISKKPENKNIQIGSFSIMKDIQNDNKLNSYITKAPSFNSFYYSQAYKSQKLPSTESIKFQNQKQQSKYLQKSKQQSKIKMYNNEDGKFQTNYNSLKNKYKINNNQNTIQSNYNSINNNISKKEEYTIKANNNNNDLEGIKNGEINQIKQQIQKEGNMAQNLKSFTSNTNNYSNKLLINKRQRSHLNNYLLKQKTDNSNQQNIYRKNSQQNQKHDLNNQTFYKQQPNQLKRDQFSKYMKSYDYQYNKKQQITLSPKFGKSQKESYWSRKQNSRISTKKNFEHYNNNKMNYMEYMKSNINPKIYNKNINNNNYYEINRNKSRQSIESNYNPVEVGKKVNYYNYYPEYNYHHTYQGNNKILYKQNKLETKKNNNNYHQKDKIVQRNLYHNNSYNQSKNNHYSYNNIKQHHYKNPSIYFQCQNSPRQQSKKANASNSNWKIYLHQQSRINNSKKNNNYMQNIIISPSRTRDYYNFENTALNSYSRQRIKKDNNSWVHTQIEYKQPYIKNGYINSPSNFISNPKDHIHQYMHYSPRQKNYKIY